MMKKLLLSMCLFLTGNIIAQTNSFVDLEGNSIKCRLNSNGDLFSDLANFSSGFRVEEGPNLYTIFSNRIVFGGIGPNGDLAFTRPHGSYNFANGPLTVNPGMEYGPATITPAQSNAWSQIFVVTQDEIDEFLDYRDCLADPNCDELIDFAGYQIPSVITNWPAHGDVALNEPKNLAPFEDVNGDYIYNPLDGDYPCIKGDVYAWFVMNNVLVDSTVNTTSSGIEIQVEVYQFDGGPSNPALSNTVFVGYDLINRSTNIWSDFYFSNYTDMDLGNPLDDYMGSLPDQNAYFTYNGDNYDENSSVGMGFEDRLPAQGVVSLNYDLASFSYADIDAHQIMEYYNVMRGFHTDGSPKLFPGTQTQTSFTFPYSQTNPFHWTESNSDGNGTQNTPGDRRVQAAIGPFIISPGTKIDLDFAFIYSRVTTPASGNEASVQQLIMDIDDVQYFYDNQMTTCSGAFLSVDELSEEAAMIFPNPMKNELMISIPFDEEMEVRLFDLNGNIVLEKLVQTNETLSVEHLPKGMYVLELTSKSLGIIHTKLIKE